MGRKLLPVRVYRSRYAGETVDCTNGGISSTAEDLYLVHPEGIYDEAKIDPKLVFVEEQRGPEYWAMIPVNQPKGKCGPMAGGNLAGSSDSRIKHVYHIHDRFESFELCRALSD